MPGINIHDQPSVQNGKTVDSSSNLVVMCPTAQTVFAHVTATTSLAGVWEGTYAQRSTAEGDADWFDVPSLKIDDAAVIENLPAATVTPDADDVMAASTMGATMVRFRRTAGSGTVSISVTNSTLADIAIASSGGSAVIIANPVSNPVQVEITDGTDTALVTASGQLSVTGGGSVDNTISTNNSTTSTLGSGATYTGTGDDVSTYTSVTIQLDSSHNSATDGMKFQFSIDNSNWDAIHSFTYTAADGARHFQFGVHAQYFRVVYTNGGTNQTTFRVQTILHRNAPLTSIHRLVDSTDPDRSANIVKSAIIAQAAGSGDFVPVAATAGGNLKVAVEEFVSSLPAGKNNLGGVELKATPVVTNATGTSAIATSYAPSADFYLDSVTLTVNVAGTTAEDFTITLNASDGSDYDTVLLKQDLSVGSVLNLVYVPDGGPMLFENGDAIDVAWPNTESRTYGLRITARLA